MGNYENRGHVLAQIKNSLMSVSHILVTLVWSNDQTEQPIEKNLTHHN